MLFFCTHKNPAVITASRVTQENVSGAEFDAMTSCANSSSRRMGQTGISASPIALSESEALVFTHATRQNAASVNAQGANN